MIGKRGIGFLLLGLALLTAVFAASFTNKPTHTIIDGQQEVTVDGRFQTVADVIDSAPISLRPQDLTIPHMDAPPPEDAEIEIVRAKSVTVRQSGQTRTYWTHLDNTQQFFDEAGILPQPGDEIVLDGEPVPLALLRSEPLPELVEIGRATAVTIIDGNQQQVIFTTANTVADVLLEADIGVDASITVSPALPAPIEEEMVITLQRGVPVTIWADGRSTTVQSSATTPRTILEEAGIMLGDLDYTIPPQDEPLGEETAVQLIRVTEEIILEESDIPFQTVWQGTDSLDLDTRALLTAGQPGVFQRQIAIRYEDGVEVGQTVISEGVVQEPINEVIGFGTKITINTVNTPAGPREYWRVVQMRVTSYTAATSGRAPDDPAYGITASGLPAGYGVVAIDRNVVPFRSELFVPGYGVAIAGDTGGGVRGRWIDLGYDEDSFVSWSGTVDVYYLTPVPAAEDINYILPTGLP